MAVNRATRVLQGTPPNPQKTPESGLSTGQIGGLIIETNAILHDEFYPSLEKDKTHQFDEIWGAIQSLLCTEAIPAAQDLAKAACDLPTNVGITTGCLHR